MKLSTPLLEVKDVSYAYHTKSGETLALSHIRFSLSKGEFLAVQTGTLKGFTRKESDQFLTKCDGFGRIQTNFESDERIF